MATWTKLGDSPGDLALSLFRGMSSDNDDRVAREPTEQTLLNAVAVEGAGTAIDVSTLVPVHHTWTVIISGALAGFHVDLEGAMNDVEAEYGILDSYEGVRTSTRSVSGKPIKFIRAKVVSLVPGLNVTPSVTVYYLGSR